MKSYTYTSRYQKKDGTLSIYTYKRSYIPREKKKVEIPEEIKKEIIYKWEIGVPKVRLSRDYNLSIRKLNEILSSAQSASAVAKVEETTCPVVKSEEGNKSETEETTCPVVKSETEESSCTVVKFEVKSEEGNKSETEAKVEEINKSELEESTCTVAKPEETEVKVEETTGGSNNSCSVKKDETDEEISELLQVLGLC